MGRGWPRTGKSDREAVETATRSAAHHIGTTVLGELLSPWQPVECDSDRRLLPCAATSRGAFREVVRPRSARPETLDRRAVAQARSRQDRGAGESPGRVLRAERHTEECGLGFPFPLRKAETCPRDSTPSPPRSAPPRHPSRSRCTRQRRSPDACSGSSSSRRAPRRQFQESVCCRARWGYPDWPSTR